MEFQEWKAALISEIETAAEVAGGNGARQR